MKTLPKTSVRVYINHEQNKIEEIIQLYNKSPGFKPLEEILLYHKHLKDEFILHLAMIEVFENLITSIQVSGFNLPDRLSIDSGETFYKIHSSKGISEPGSTAGFIVSYYLVKTLSSL